MTEKLIDDGGQAFPVPADDKAGWHSQEGMSLRDWFAGQALAGLYACRYLQMATLYDITKINSGEFEETIAKQCYRQADAMIAERKGGVE